MDGAGARGRGDAGFRARQAFCLSTAAGFAWAFDRDRAWLWLRRSKYFQRRDGADVQALIHLVAQGRSEAGILDRLKWRYLQHEHAMLQGARWQVEEGPTINRPQLRLRLHQQQAN